MKRLWVCALAVLLAGATAATSQAAELEIQFLGLDLVYDGTDLYDAKNKVGGIGDPAEADKLSAMEFSVDGSLVGSLSSDIWSDVFISGVSNIPATGGFVTSAGNGDDFGFDLITDNSGNGVRLDLDSVQVFYTGSEVAISGGALASKLAFQNLPFGLQIDATKPITIAFSSANVSQVTDNGQVVTGFRASGTGNIRAQLVPEPASGLLLTLGLAGCVGGLRRRRRA